MTNDKLGPHRAGRVPRQSLTPSRLATPMAGLLALLCAASAHAGSPPKLKEGLWEIHGESTVQPGDKKKELTYRLCRDHAYDKAANAILMQIKGCTTEMKDAGNGRFNSASKCNVNGTTIISGGFTLFTSDISMHSETQSRFMPAFEGKTDEFVIQDQRYVGACPATMKAGDTISAEGFIRHQN